MVSGRLCPCSCGKNGDSGRDGEVDVGTDGKESNKGEIIEELLESSDTPSDMGDVVRAGAGPFPDKNRESMCKGCIASSGRRAVLKVEGVLCGV